MYTPIRLGNSVQDDPCPGLLSDLARVAAREHVALTAPTCDAVPTSSRSTSTRSARHGTPVSLGSDARLPRSVGGVRRVIPMLRERGTKTASRASGGGR